MDGDIDTAAGVREYLQGVNVASRARASMAQASDANPELEAELRAVSARTGVPISSARAFPAEARRRALVAQDFEGMAERFPATMGFLAEQEGARIAHDDLENLAGLEDRVRQFGALKAPTNEPTLTSVASGIADSLGQGFRLVREGLRVQAGDALGLPTDDALRRYQQEAARVRDSMPDFESSTARGLYGGATSLVRMLPATAASIALRSPAPVLTMAGLQTQAEAYGKYRSRDASPLMAFTAAGAEGAVEAATELLPMSFLVNRLGKTGMGSFLTGYLAREMPTEQVATIVQDAIDTAVANPDKTWDQFWRERPDAAYQTALATLVQSGVFAGANAAAGRLARRQAGEQDGQVLADVMAMAAESKLRERDPQAFAGLVASAAEKAGAPAEVFIDAREIANALEQSGITVDQVVEALPSLRDQLAEALASGGDVVVPLGEFAAGVAGSPLGQVLMQHARTEPDALSAAEAKKADPAKMLGDAAAQVAAQAQTEQADTTSRDAVRQIVLQDLQAAGRFTDDVNQAYADLTARFFEQTARRVGKTAEALYAQYPLKVRGSGAMGAVLQQGQTETPEFRAWFGNSKVVDSTGKPLVVYHGTQNAFSTFDYSKIGQQGRSEGAGFYFTNNRDVASGYGEPMQVFLAINKPLRYDAKGFSKPVLQKIVRRVAELEAAATGGPLEDGFLANFGDVRYGGIAAVARDAANLIGADETAVDQLSGIVGSGVSPEFVNKATRDVTGHDGIVAEGFSNEGDASNRIFIAFFPEQIKSAIGNRGTFDPNDPSILNQTETPREVIDLRKREKVLQRLMECLA